MRKGIILDVAILIIGFCLLTWVFIRYANSVEESRFDAEVLQEAIEESIDTVKEQVEQPVDSTQGGYVFTVPQHNVEQEVNVEDVEEEQIVLNNYDKVGCLILYKVDSVNLREDLIKDGQAIYTWVVGTNEYYVFLKCLKTDVKQYQSLYDNLLSEDWCLENGYVLINYSDVETLIGDGKAFSYKQGKNLQRFVAFIELKNSYTCIIEIEAEQEFDKELEIVRDILSNGVTVVLSNSEEEELSEAE